MTWVDAVDLYGNPVISNSSFAPYTLYVGGYADFTNAASSSIDISWEVVIPY